MAYLFARKENNVSSENGQLQMTDIPERQKSQSRSYILARLRNGRSSNLSNFEHPLPLESINSNSNNNDQNRNPRSMMIAANIEANTSACKSKNHHYLNDFAVNMGCSTGASALFGGDTPSNPSSKNAHRNPIIDFCNNKNLRSDHSAPKECSLASRTPLTQQKQFQQQQQQQPIYPQQHYPPQQSQSQQQQHYSAGVKHSQNNNQTINNSNNTTNNNNNNISNNSSSNQPSWGNCLNLPKLSQNILQLRQQQQLLQPQQKQQLTAISTSIPTTPSKKPIGSFVRHPLHEIAQESASIDSQNAQHYHPHTVHKQQSLPTNSTTTTIAGTSCNVVSQAQQAATVTTGGIPLKLANRYRSQTKDSSIQPDPSNNQQKNDVFNFTRGSRRPSQIQETIFDQPLQTQQQQQQLQQQLGSVNSLHLQQQQQQTGTNSIIVAQLSTVECKTAQQDVKFPLIKQSNPLSLARQRETIAFAQLRENNLKNAKELPSIIENIKQNVSSCENLFQNRLKERANAIPALLKPLSSAVNLFKEAMMSSYHSQQAEKLASQTLTASISAAPQLLPGAQYPQQSQTIDSSNQTIQQISQNIESSTILRPEESPNKNAEITSKIPSIQQEKSLGRSSEKSRRHSQSDNPQSNNQEHNSNSSIEASKFFGMKQTSNESIRSAKNKSTILALGQVDKQSSATASVEIQRISSHELLKQEASITQQMSPSNRIMIIPDQSSIMALSPLAESKHSIMERRNSQDQTIDDQPFPAQNIGRSIEQVQQFVQECAENEEQPQQSQFETLQYPQKGNTIDVEQVLQASTTEKRKLKKLHQINDYLQSKLESQRSQSKLPNHSTAPLVVVAQAAESTNKELMPQLSKNIRENQASNRSISAKIPIISETAGIQHSQAELELQLQGSTTNNNIIGYEEDDNKTLLDSIVNQSIGALDNPSTSRQRLKSLGAVVAAAAAAGATSSDGSTAIIGGEIDDQILQQQMNPSSIQEQVTSRSISSRSLSQQQVSQPSQNFDVLKKHKRSSVSKSTKPRDIIRHASPIPFVNGSLLRVRDSAVGYASNSSAKKHSRMHCVEEATVEGHAPVQTEAEESKAIALQLDREIVRLNQLSSKNNIARQEQLRIQEELIKYSLQTKITRKKQIETVLENDHEDVS